MGSEMCIRDSNYSLNFDGQDDYVAVANSNSLGLVDAVTITAWIKPDDLSSEGAILAKRNFNGGERTNYMIWIKPNGTIGFQFNYNNSIRGDLTGSSAVPLNQWSHVAITYDRSTIDSYIDGQLDQSVSETDPMTPNDNMVSIGRVIRESNSNFAEFDGLISEVSLWSRALTQSEIEETMYDLDPDSEGLVSYWKFSEGSGSLLSDHASSNNNGEINGALWSEGVPAPPVPPVLGGNNSLRFDGVDDYADFGEGNNLFDLNKFKICELRLMVI